VRDSETAAAAAAAAAAAVAVVSLAQCWLHGGWSLRPRARWDAGKAAAVAALSAGML
jgi:hypothetical protein